MKRYAQLLCTLILVCVLIIPAGCSKKKVKKDAGLEGAGIEETKRPGEEGLEEKGYIQWETKAARRIRTRYRNRR